MKTDHSEFIARHHKTAQQATGKAAGKRDYTGLFSFLVFVIYAAILISVAWVAHTSDIDVIIALGAVFAASLTVFVCHRTYSYHKNKNHELALLSQVLQGSRGARLITDENDKTIYTNLRFDDLCKGIGPPGFKTLVRLFENNNQVINHFRLLADQAHRGLTDTIEIFSKYEDRDRWFSVTAQPIEGWAGHIHWRVDDVTEKYTVDTAIREEREKLIDFTDNAPVGFFSVNENGKFVFANATFARWVGTDIQTLLSVSHLHTFMAEPLQNAKPYDVIEGGGSRQVTEIKMKGPAGKTFLASISQTVVQEEDGRVRTRGVVHDLTSEREMRRALQASEDRFQRFFAEAPLGIAVVNTDEVIEDCNTQFAQILGLDITAIENRHFEHFIDPEFREDVLTTIRRIGEGKQMTGPVEIRLKGKDRTVETQMHARHFGGTQSVVLHFIDLTQQKALEEQFVQSQKMQAIGQLAGGVAHDFNNLLTAIIGFCDLLLLRHKPGDPSFSDIMQIKQNSNRASNLVRQLLAFSRQQTLRPKVQDITDILTELSNLLRRLIGANIELDVVYNSDLGLVKVDEGQMEQVLINLAVNARDAMEEGGQLTITTGNYTNRKPEELVSEELPPGHWTVIKVTDTGHGIPKKIIGRIFEPFFTTKEVGHGTGLGLATVYGIIRQTGGYLDVESKVKKGTTFTIYLPHATDTESAEDDTPKIEEDKTRDLTGTERILLVEDEDAVRTFSQRALTNKGYDVITADSGESALEVWGAQDNKQLDLLVTDVVMPAMDGPTLAKHMREESPDLKIIFMSGYTEDRLKDHMGEGIYFLPKPFTLKQLAAKVKEVLGE